MGRNHLSIILFPQGKALQVGAWFAHLKTLGGLVEVCSRPSLVCAQRGQHPGAGQRQGPSCDSPMDPVSSVNTTGISGLLGHSLKTATLGIDNKEQPSGSVFAWGVVGLLPGALGRCALQGG